tara:strand:+ start:493 stop:816 length:324 start_codon:yes stop_codon:yes gene_type:complete
MEFSKLKFKPMPSLPDSKQCIIDLGKHELSIVQHQFSYGGKDGFYEVGYMKKNGGMIDLPPQVAKSKLSDQVKGWLTEQDVMKIIKQLCDHNKLDYNFVCMKTRLVT